jgi:hypothetical protein
MTSQRPSMPGRHFVFHPDDALAWSELMRQRFRELRYYDAPLSGELRPGKSPFDLRLRTSLHGGAGEDFRSIDLVFDETWRPEWTKDRMGGWTLGSPPYPNATIRYLGGRIFEETTVRDGYEYVRGEERHRVPDRVEPPRITGGQIYFRCEKGNPEHMRVARAALRLIAKVATNKVAVVHYPSLKVVPQESGGPGVTWCGFHAIDWCRKAPDRFLNYRSTNEGNEGYGLRPLD